MNTWATMAEAITDLRRFVNDGPLDRPVKEKIVIGAADGTNLTFMVWDDRIIPATLKVTVDFVPVPPSEVDQTDYIDADSGLNILGQFDLSTPPAATAAVRAQYFYLYFLDSELTEAMQMGAQEIVEGDDPTQIGPGLKLAALHFAGGFAYQKQAMRWAQRMSNRFLVLEEPSQADANVRPNLFRQIAKDLFDKGEVLRENYYKRHGRRAAPAFGVFKPRIPGVGPRT